MSGENFLSGQFQPFAKNADGTLKPCAGYKAKFYEAGTDIPKTIYTDPDLEVPYSTPSNIAYLDDTGKALIYLGEGAYKLVLTDPNDNPVSGYTIDNISGNVNFGTGFVNSFADLAGVNTTIYPYTYIGGYYVPGDGGEGMFYNETSSQALDGGYVQESTFDPTKRWLRIPDEDGDVRAASFGFCGSGDKTSNLQAADSYAATIGARLRIQIDPCTVTSVTLSAPTIVFNQDAALYAGVGTNTLTINGIVEAGDWKLFFDWNAVTLANPSQTSTPYWFGGSPSETAAANVTAFTDWKNAGAGVFVLPAGNWKYTGTFAPSYSKPTRFDGNIFYGDGPSIQIYPGLYYPGIESKIHTALVEFPNGAILSADDANGVQTSDNFEAAASISAGTSLFVGTDANITGNVEAGGTVQGASVVSNGSVTAGSDVIAGALLTGEMGSSGQQFNAGGRGEVKYATTSPWAGDCTLPAFALLSNGQYIRIVAFGESFMSYPVNVIITVGNASGSAKEVFNKSLTVTGSTDKQYRVEVIVVRTGATTASCFGIFTLSSTTNDTVVQFKTATIDWSIQNTIAVSAGATPAKQLLMYEVFQ